MSENITRALTGKSTFQSNAPATSSLAQLFDMLSSNQSAKSASKNQQLQTLLQTPNASKIAESTASLRRKGILNPGSATPGLDALYRMNPQSANKSTGNPFGQGDYALRRYEQLLQEQAKIRALQEKYGPKKPAPNKAATDVAGAAASLNETPEQAFGVITHKPR